MAKKKEEILEETPKREPLAKRLQKLDAFFEAASKNSGVIAGRPTKSKEVRDRMTFHYIDTPIPAVNEALGGGLPRGHMVLIAGKEDSGKTGFCLSTIGYQMQKDPNFIALWVESEDSLDLKKIQRLYGIDMDRFYCVTTIDPKTKKQVHGAEAVGNNIIAAIRCENFDMCVINSLKMLVPMQEATKTLDADTVAVAARFNSKFVRQAIPLCAQRGTNLTVIEHYSTDLTSGPYGNPNIISGGKAIRYNNMVTLEFGTLKPDEKDPISSETGMKIKIRVTKNHCVIDRNPRVDIIYYIEYGKGVEKYITTLQELLKHGILEQHGAWINLMDENGEKDPDMSWNGRLAFKEDMIANPTKFDTLCAMLDGFTSSNVKALTKEECDELDEKERELEKEVKNAEGDDKK